MSRPKPETDALRKSIDNGANAEAEMTSFARKLERERDKAIRQLDNLNATAIHSCHNECQRPMCVLRRERDEAREAGWKLAMQAVWDRLPMPAFANDPMTPREVAKLIEFVRCQKEETK